MKLRKHDLSICTFADKRQIKHTETISSSAVSLARGYKVCTLLRDTRYYSCYQFEEIYRGIYTSVSNYVKRDSRRSRQHPVTSYVCGTPRAGTCQMRYHRTLTKLKCVTEHSSYYSGCCGWRDASKKKKLMTCPSSSPGRVTRIIANKPIARNAL